MAYRDVICVRRELCDELELVSSSRDVQVLARLGGWAHRLVARCGMVWVFLPGLRELFLCGLKTDLKVEEDRNWGFEKVEDGMYLDSEKLI